jgi:hypothetical protein
MPCDAALIGPGQDGVAGKPVVADHGQDGRDGVELRGDNCARAPPMRDQANPIETVASVGAGSPSRVSAGCFGPEPSRRAFSQGIPPSVYAEQRGGVRAMFFTRAGVPVIRRQG